jgi:hypothetical protein
MTSLSEVNGCKTKARAGAHLPVDLVPTDGEEHETDDLKCNLSGKVERKTREKTHDHQAARKAEHVVNTAK